MLGLVHNSFILLHGYSVVMIYDVLVGTCGVKPSFPLATFFSPTASIQGVLYDGLEDLGIFLKIETIKDGKIRY